MNMIYVGLSMDEMVLRGIVECFTGNIKKVLDNDKELC